eukprot:TRINITY_DN7713_c0_g2_i1.p1 TRINITY_DN7713_c0_g2~~TRINITY_DN7713_c0_g2_i1.p1  ORF type:complete len:489 (+),score=109.59 TRINITY_DN7713_c0_g2_i1:55-1521(+)
MMSGSLSRIKHESESRLAEEKRVQDRRRNVLILIERYLLSLGYLDTVNKLQAESNISLDKWDVADNMDLYMIVTEFEQFYEMKFGKAPKLAKKLTPDEERKSTLPRIPANSGGTAERAGKGSAGTPVSKPTNRKPPLPKDEETRPNTDKSDLMEIKGNAVVAQPAAKKGDDNDEFFDNRVLKAMPTFDDQPELRELAAALRRDIIIANPNVKFEDVVGNGEAKRLLKEAVIMPMKYPTLFTGLLEPWRGVLLFGPPGTGKTLMAKAVATECKTTFFNISASSIVSKWRGDSEKLVRVLFELARHFEPSTVFIDEIDSLMSHRSSGDGEHEGSRRMKTELLIQMDGLVKNKERVFVLAASNLPWDLDIALLRRLEKRILVPLPDAQARADMVRRFLPPDRTADLDYDEGGRLLENYSGSDIKLLCKEAAMRPIRKIMKLLEEGTKLDEKKIEVDLITEEDFRAAAEKTRPSPLLHIEKYVRWEKEYGSV